MKSVIKILFFSLISFNLLAQSVLIMPGSILPTKTTVERLAAPSPADGTLVFDSNTQSYWFRKSGAWVELNGSSPNYWGLNGLEGNEIKNSNSGGFWSEGDTILTSLSSTIAVAPTQGIGTRLMWIPMRSAFRVGTVSTTGGSGTEWDKDSIGMFSTAIGYNTKASENFSTAFGNRAEATGQNSTAIGYLSKAEGLNSFAIGHGTLAKAGTSMAMGYQTTTSGYSSIALGSGSIASERYAMALGTFTLASGDGSTAMGVSSEARGANSTATGERTISKAHGSFSAGGFNDTLDVVSNSIAPLNRLFQIGNGTQLSRSNAFTVLRNSQTGINTATPLAALHIKSVPDGDDNWDRHIRLEYDSTQYGNIAYDGDGMKFRTQADNDNFYFRNSNNISTMVLSKDGSVAIGQQALASFGGVALGYKAKSENISSNAIGEQTTASGNYSTAIGYVARATAEGALALGHISTASGDYSTVLGNSLVAKAENSLSVGAFNDNSDVPSGGDSDRIFQLGNGSSAARSNALTVLRNSYLGINTGTPLSGLHLVGSNNSWNTHIRLEHYNDSDAYGNILYDDNGMKFRTQRAGDDFYFRNQANTTTMLLTEGGDMTISGSNYNTSDRRLKTGFSRLSNSLGNILDLKTYNYHWKSKDKNQKLQTGVIAQEIQEIFPELVHEDGKGFLSVNYTGLIPHLVESVKSLNSNIKVLAEALEASHRINKILEVKLESIEAVTKTQSSQYLILKNELNVFKEMMLQSMSLKE